MKSLLFFCISMLSIDVFASEIISLKADMNYKRCEEVGAVSYNCTFDYPVLKEIKVELKATEDSELLAGSYQFTKQLDGFTFVGTISIFKLFNNSDSLYILDTNVEHIFGDDPSTQRMQYLGNVEVEDFAKLAAITWVGGEVTSKRISINPTITVSASQ